MSRCLRRALRGAGLLLGLVVVLWVGAAAASAAPAETRSPSAPGQRPDPVACRVADAVHPGLTEAFVTSTCQTTGTLPELPAGCYWRFYDHYEEFKIDDDHRDRPLIALNTCGAPPTNAGVAGEPCSGEDAAYDPASTEVHRLLAHQQGCLWVRCRDEQDLGADDWQTKSVPSDVPTWWYDEVSRETGVDGGKGCNLADHVPTSCEGVDPDTYDNDGIIPDRCWGTYPSDHYELSWDDGAAWDPRKWHTRLMGWITAFMFEIGKNAVLVALWLVDWAYSFDLTRYTRLAERIGGRYQDHLVGPWGVEDFAWFALVVWAGITALRNKIGRAGGEIALAVVVGALATFLFDHRADYMESVADRIDLTTGDLLYAGQGVTPPRTTNRIDARAYVRSQLRPMQSRLHREFVEYPFAYLNYGTTPEGPCLDAANNITATGYDRDGWPSRYLNSGGCTSEAEFNEDVSWRRLFSALLTMIFACIAAAFVGLAALTVLFSKLLVAVLFALLPFAAAVAVLPGAGRRLSWSWVGTLVQLVVTAVGMTFMLALLLLAMDLVLTTGTDPDTAVLDPDTPLAERWAIATFMASAAFFGRKRLLTGAQSLATSTADSLTRLSPAAANWSGGRPTGFDLERPDRIAGRAMVGAAWGVGGAALAGGTVWAGRRRERRVAERSYRNTRRLMGARVMYRADAYQFDGEPRRADNGSGGSGGGSGGGKPKNDTYYPRRGFLRRRQTSIPRIQDPSNPDRHGRPDMYREQMRLDLTRTVPRGRLRHPIKGTIDRLDDRAVARRGRRIAYSLTRGRPRHPRLARMGLAHRGREYRGFP